MFVQSQEFSSVIQECARIPSRFGRSDGLIDKHLQIRSLTPAKTNCQSHTVFSNNIFFQFSATQCYNCIHKTSSSDYLSLLSGLRMRGGLLKKLGADSHLTYLLNAVNCGLAVRLLPLKWPR